MLFSLPKEYREADVDELNERIRAARERLGDRLCILTHHYQRLEVDEELVIQRQIGNRPAREEQADIHL